MEMTVIENLLFMYYQNCSAICSTSIFQKKHWILNITLNSYRQINAKKVTFGYSACILQFFWFFQHLQSKVYYSRKF